MSHEDIPAGALLIVTSEDSDNSWPRARGLEVLYSTIKLSPAVFSQGHVVLLYHCDEFEYLQRMEQKCVQVTLKLET